MNTFKTNFLKPGPLGGDGLTLPYFQYSVVTYLQHFLINPLSFSLSGFFQSDKQRLNKQNLKTIIMSEGYAWSLFWFVYACFCFCFASDSPKKPCSLQLQRFLPLFSPKTSFFFCFFFLIFSPFSFFIFSLSFVHCQFLFKQLFFWFWPIFLSFFAFCFLMLLLFGSGFASSCLLFFFENQLCCRGFLFFSHMALNPPYFLCVCFFTFVLFFGGFKGQMRGPKGHLTWPLTLLICLSFFVFVCFIVWFVS